MQTFLPYEDFSKSAECLDNKRLGKQRVECKQILLALEIPVGEHKPKSSSWRNHPAVKMWRDNEFCLAQYAMVMCIEWISRGFKDKLLPEFSDVARSIYCAQTIYAATATRTPVEIVKLVAPKPDWLGMELLHTSHRSNLLRKDSTHYGKFGWEEPDCLPYFWPV